MNNLQKLAADILEDGIVDAREVAQLRETLYADGVIDREEADLLFHINDAVTNNDNHPSWKAFFVNALTKHVLDDDVSPGVLDDEETGYLMAKIEGDGQVDASELALLVNITAKAKATSDLFQTFVLKSLASSVLEDGVIDDEEVTMIRQVIFGTGGGGGEGVDREEATFLFELNDAVTGRKNTPAWTTLFVEAIGKHVLEDDASPGAIDADEAEWLIGCIEGDGEYDSTEKALLAHIKEHATFMPDRLRTKMAQSGV